MNLRRKALIVTAFGIAIYFGVNLTPAQAATLASQSDSGTTFTSCATPFGDGCAEYSSYGTQTFVPNAGILKNLEFYGETSPSAFFVVLLHNDTQDTPTKFFSTNNYVAGKTDGTNEMELYNLSGADFSDAIVFNGTDTWSLTIFAFGNSWVCLNVGGIACYIPSEHLGNSSNQIYFSINDEPLVETLPVEKFFCTVREENTCWTESPFSFYEYYIYAGSYPNTSVELRHLSPGHYLSNGFYVGQYGQNHWWKFVDYNNVYYMNILYSNGVWSGEPPEPSGCTENCFSNVLFLPGIMGSRLHEGGNRLWEPGSESDVLALYLGDDGKSLNQNITVGDVIDEVPVTRGNIYKSFLSDLELKKSEGVIEDYLAVPYDWRLSLEDILSDGSLEDRLRALAESSRTGKVAVVAHSNGGLLAKALINKLGAEASLLIDQLILVAVPQIGTPQAVGALLHGYDTSIPSDWFPLILSAERARDFLKNAPFVYQLLPHPDYYQTAGASTSTPLVSFLDGVATKLFSDAYGLVIGNGDEFHDFLTGTEERATPAYSDLKNPSVANNLLLTNAESLARSIGSSWQAPAGITVHQIAGIGEDTLSGITYKTVKKCAQTIPIGIIGFPLCVKYEPTLSYIPNEVIDGDGTVVVPSALAMSDSASNVNRWWVNLGKNNDENNRLWIFRLNHKNIFEVPELRTFIFDNLISNDSDATPNYISSTQPLITSANRLRFVLHSPLSLSARSTVDGTEYPAKRYGEVQVVTVPAEARPTLILEGESEGSFTLDIEEWIEDQIVASTTFSGIPSTSEIVVTMEFPEGTLENASDLAVDYNGDGAADTTLTPQLGEEVFFDEPSLTDLLAILKSKIQNLNIKDKLKQNLFKKVENLEKKIEKKKEKNAKTLAKLEKQVTQKQIKGKIDDASAEEILELINLLEAQSDSISLDVDILGDLKIKVQSLNTKPGIKNELLKKVEKLEKKQMLTRILANLTANIVRRGEKGIINDNDASEMLQLLEIIEAHI